MLHLKPTFMMLSQKKNSLILTEIKCYFFFIFWIKLVQSLYMLNCTFPVSHSDYSWFKDFALFCMLYAFFWVIPRCLEFICRLTSTRLWRWNRQSVPKRRNINSRRRGITQKKTYNILIMLIWSFRGLDGCLQVCYQLVLTSIPDQSISYLFWTKWYLKKSIYLPCNYHSTSFSCTFILSTTDAT